MRRARTSETEMLVWAFLVLMVLPAMIGAAGATAASYLTYRVTLGFLGGIWRSWYSSYNGSAYYALQPKAAAALASIAAITRTGATKVAQAQLDLWLDVYDPLGLVRDAIEARGIDTNSPLFEELGR